eukprot:365210-Chlamydomonas_euryale.AAC.1
MVRLSKPSRQVFQAFQGPAVPPRRRHRRPASHAGRATVAPCGSRRPSPSRYGPGGGARRGLRPSITGLSAAWRRAVPKLSDRPDGRWQRRPHAPRRVWGCPAALTGRRRLVGDSASSQPVCGTWPEAPPTRPRRPRRRRRDAPRHRRCDSGVPPPPEPRAARWAARRAGAGARLTRIPSSRRRIARCLRAIARSRHGTMPRSRRCRRR